MDRIFLTDRFSLSRIALGFWRLAEWGMDTKQLTRFVQKALDLGVTGFDHADIYGQYGNEAQFGKILKSNPGLRSQMQIITKTGIKIKSDRFPVLKITHYDTSFKHIVRQVEQSLTNFHTDYLDLLLIHRPNPLMDPTETTRAFEELEKSGKVLHFGVSNFLPIEFEMLNGYFGNKLVTNQVEISPYQLEHFHNGNMDFFVKEKIHPMAWSPLAQGRLFLPEDDKTERIHQKLKEIAVRHGVISIDKIIFAWLLKHPAGIIPIVGTGKIERVQSAVDALNMGITTEEWFEIYVASMGHRVP